MNKWRARSAAAMAAAVLWLAGNAHGAPAAAAFLERGAGEEIVYFLLPDRFANGDAGNDSGGLSGDRLQTGFDPSAKGFFHGGDLRGLTARLDYIQSLGATAIWLGPIYRNKPVQGQPGDESAGYHGYWITDFTSVDPHFGSAADLDRLVTAAHARGMKLYLDIVVNHTADVIRYRECPDSACPYRSLGDYPDTRRGGVDGAAINDGFAGEAVRTTDNFARLVRPDFAYTPYVPAAEAHLKVPDWLNDPIYYHNRGNSTFEGESSTRGDFSGLDDLMTENPRVLQGFIDIYGAWIDRYGIDGFRIDTAKHVNPEFWQAFVPAMRARAAKRGIRNFHIFGEVASSELDVALLAQHTRVDRLPAVLDFGFFAAVRDTVAGQAGTDELARLFAGDVLYADGAATARQLPTFVSNHDNGRFAWFVRRARPDASDSEVLQRVQLAYAMLLTLRGVPVVYYGDEQGFEGRGDDQAARQDMFGSRVASYNDQALLGTDATTASSRFDTTHPLYRFIAGLARLRAAQPALRHGSQDLIGASPKPGLFAVARTDPASGAELIVAFNTATTAIDARIPVAVTATQFHALYGDCAATADAPGSYRLQLPPLGFAVCAVTKPH